MSIPMVSGHRLHIIHDNANRLQFRWPNIIICCCFFIYIELDGKNENDQ